MSAAMSCHAARPAGTVPGMTGGSRGRVTVVGFGRHLCLWPSGDRRACVAPGLRLLSLPLSTGRTLRLEAASVTAAFTKRFHANHARTHTGSLPPSGAIVRCGRTKRLIYKFLRILLGQSVSRRLAPFRSKPSSHSTPPKRSSRQLTGRLCDRSDRAITR